MKTLHYDCFAGISGDMNLGALLDLGVETAFLRNELGKLKLGDFQLRVTREQRRGIAGTRVQVVTSEAEDPPRRTLETINQLIGRSSLASAVKQRSLRIFKRLAEAEAKVHGIPLDAVHFHEVGGVDAIVDIVGASAALERLGVERVTSTTIELGAGWAECAHGRLPVPAPATLELLRGVPVRRGTVPFEATTPTGAAIVSSIAGEFCDQVEYVPRRIGHGVGARDGPLPNVLRVILADQTDRPTRAADLVLLECNIDDMNPELYDYVMERLFEQGALDVWLTPVIMKRGRPGILLGVLCRAPQRQSLSAVIFGETTSLGVRYHAVGRSALERQTRVVETRFGPIPVKFASVSGESERAKPEYLACRRVARERGVPISVVYAEVDRCLKEGIRPRPPNAPDKVNLP